MKMISTCSADNYVCADDDLPTYIDMDNDNWEDIFFAEVGSKKSRLDVSVEAVEEDEYYDWTEEVDRTPEGKLTSFSEALAALEDVSTFLESRGYASEATSVMTMTSTLQASVCELSTNVPS